MERDLVRLSAFLIVLVAFSGCAGQQQQQKQPPPGEKCEACEKGAVSSTGPAEPTAEPVTFNKHVAPILWKNCASCHHPGQVAPFPLLTYKDAEKRAAFLRQVTQTRRMPPWRAEPGYGPFTNEPH